VTGFGNQTLREIVRVSIGGVAVRLHLSNRYGRHPLTIGTVTVAAGAHGAALTGRPAVARFGGRRATSIPAGGEAVSDPVPMPVPALQKLAVSIYLPGATGPTTNHDLAEQVSYISGKGNHAGATGARAFGAQATSWFYLAGIDVRPAGAGAGAVVALGDSITDGAHSRVGGNSRWPDVLAARLETSARPMGVLNEGISGNRVLHNSACFGASALARLGADVLNQPGARVVILLEGINDIGFPTQPGAGCSLPDPAVAAQQVIAGYQRIIARAHARGLRVIGATLIPMAGSAYWSASTERERLRVNAWIRDSHAFDAVIDFDKVLRDPADPDRLLPADDSGDHLHPNDAGYRAMGDAVNLTLLR
jgi:lysophospholipase L1-like esterase